MKILVTGGSGFLGSRVVKRLIADGHNVFALARSDAAESKVKALGAIPFRGDISDVASMEAGLSQFECVAHCAAPVEFWGPWRKFEDGIVKSTLELFAACDRQGVKRFIHVSSESVLQDRLPLVDIDESFPYPAEPNSFYGKAKMIAEQALLKIPAKMELVIIRPTFIWGPGCPAFGEISKKVKSGQFLWIDHGVSSFEAVHVDNVAEAICLAAHNGKDRGVYFITDNEPTTVREFFTQVFRSMSLPLPTRSIPAGLAGFMAAGVEAVWNGLRLRSVPPLTRFDLAFVAQPRRYKIAAAQRELKYTPVVSRALGMSGLVS